MRTSGVCFCVTAFDRTAELARIGAERLAAEREIERWERWNVVRCALEIVASCVVGMVIMGVGFWVNDVKLGWAFVWAGMAIGYSGMLLSLMLAYHRRWERHDE